MSDDKQPKMVERVAMALLKKHDRENGDGDYTDMARAAIEAMRDYFSHTTSSEYDGFIDEVDRALK